MTIKHLLTAALIVAALVFLASCDDADARRTAPTIPPHIHHQL